MFLLTLDLLIFTQLIQKLSQKQILAQANITLKIKILPSSTKYKQYQVARTYNYQIILQLQLVMLEYYRCISLLLIEQNKYNCYRN